MVQRQQAAQDFIGGQVCPARGVGAAFVLPRANIDAMNLHLAEISARVASGAHAVVTMNDTGWHKPADRLTMPATVGALLLPPCSPQLNPQENVWQYLRQNYLSDRVFDTDEAIVDACCDAWNAPIAQPNRITSIATREWAKQGTV